jgi:hypothetical protein
MVRAMKNFSLSILALAVLSFGVVGCGDDDDDDVATIDAAAGSVDAPVGAIDAAAPTADAGPASAACVSYCACMPTNCPTQYTGTLGGTEATCLEMCGAVEAATQECRDLHCSMATGAGASTHCPHSVGIGLCQ